MKKYFTTFLILFLVLACISSAWAFVMYDGKAKAKVKHATYIGFADYPPFGAVENPYQHNPGIFSSVFKPLIAHLEEVENFEFQAAFLSSNYRNSVSMVRTGHVDLLLGMYSETKLYNGIELVYPAAFVNPITIIMLPTRINEVTSSNDIKKLKGVRIEHEVFSDYVEKQIESLNVYKVKTSYALFEQLFTKKADYIITSQYFGLIEASKLGLRNQISVAKQALWQEPMFVGISKLSKNREMLNQRITAFFTNPKNREKMKQTIIDMVNNIDAQTDGVVQSTFGLE